MADNVEFKINIDRNNTLANVEWVDLGIKADKPDSTNRGSEEQGRPVEALAP